MERKENEELSLRDYTFFSKKCLDGNSVAI
jgi:hypothetical protein